MKILKRLHNIKEKLLLFFERVNSIDARISSIYDILYYREYVTNKLKRKVIYTCITGNYDNLICHTYINFDFDYICFTDNERLLKMPYYGVWSIRPLQYKELDNTRNNRWHKLHPHILFSDYEESVYIDSNIDIKNDYLFSILELENDCEISLKIPIHSKTNCVYKECKRVIKYRRENKCDTYKTEYLLRKESFPANYGMTENSIIYRKHNNKIIIEMMDMWWHLIENYSKRDQLTLPYVLWKHNISPYDISLPNARKDKKHFTFYSHKESSQIL
jgi:hypothetical protein